MKTIITFFLLIICNIVSSQIIKIKVSSVADAYTNDTSIINLHKNDSLNYEFRQVDGIYEIDLTNRHFTHISHNSLESDGDIAFNNSNDLILVNFLIDDLNVGVVINLDINNEQVTWFSITEGGIELSRFVNFVIVKNN